jgi:YggT family protein
MFILGNFLKALAIVLDNVIPWVYWLIIVRVVISWFNPDPYNFLFQLLYKLTEPILSPFRRLIPIYNVGIDISPILAVLALIFLQHFLVSSLYQLGNMLR